MSKVDALLNMRMKKSESSKMSAMARQSANGQLTSFSGMFGVSELSDIERLKIEGILKEYTLDDDIGSDLNVLLSITSEVKAINNQAALLHGERIKKGHDILVRYRDGAFTAWLIAAYGNRQTPYNLMQYYEFCEAMPKTLRLQIEAMPRQAIYTLASREGPLEKKKSIVENYKGQTKVELLSMIREAFPLDDKDGRRRNVGEATIGALKRLRLELKKGRPTFSHAQKEALNSLLADIHEIIDNAKIR